MPKRISNLPHLTPIRRALRERSTPYEKILWSKLRDRRFFGIKFRRQHSLENFVVDFFCPEKKLVIELDGETHCSDQQTIERDRKLERLLEQESLKLLRFSNLEIKENLEGCLLKLQDVLEI